MDSRTRRDVCKLTEQLCTVYLWLSSGREEQLADLPNGRPVSTPNAYNASHTGSAECDQPITPGTPAQCAGDVSVRPVPARVRVRCVIERERLRAALRGAEKQ
jgi:hypothetical protein